MDYEQSKEYRGIKRAMLADLKKRGLTSVLYTDKVQEYMDFWVQFQMLKDDVRARGVSVESGQGRMVENKSVSLCATASKQMQAIFTLLGFRPDVLAAAKAATGKEDEL